MQTREMAKKNSFFFVISECSLPYLKVVIFFYHTALDEKTARKNPPAAGRVDVYL